MAKADDEYKRAGRRNLYVAVEPRGRQREVAGAAWRTKPDLVPFMGRLVETG